MVNKDRLAELIRVDRQLPEITRASFKLIFCLASLAILCTSAAGQEDTTEYWMNRAEELTHNGSIEESISAYDKALKIEPENTTILIQKASDLNIIGKENESLETYQKALSILDQKLKENQSDAKVWREKAGVLRSLNRQNESIQAYEWALEAYEGRIEKNPKDAEAWLGKAHVLHILGRWDEARASYDNATKASPEDYEAWWEKGQFLSATGNISEAVKDYDRAIELIPTNETAQLRLVWADRTEELAAADRWEDALQSANRTLELDPKSSVMWHFKAFILTNLGRKEDALATFDEALSNNPKDILNWQYKAGLLVEMKMYNESLEAYERVLELIPEEDTEKKAQSLLAKGLALNRAGRHDEAKGDLQRALELFDEAISASPDDISLLQSRGWTLYELGRYEDALAVYDEILRRSPGIAPYLAHTSAQIGRGDALRALGRDQEAVDAYNRAIETGPNFDTAWRGKGEAQKALGQAYNASMSFFVADKLGYEV
ncbi:MAG: tetratricopeptide repeat protein [Methanothrix sp.]|nr:tetratricopeptide repeat protein [Methanothrix sp.]